MQDGGYALPRIHLLGTWVNSGLQVCTLSLPPLREQAEVQEDGQAHAQDHAHQYPEQATPTQQMAPSL